MSLGLVGHFKFIDLYGIFSTAFCTNKNKKKKKKKKKKNNNNNN